MGFEEVAHTADWSMRVWADDLASLFAEAARGMNALAGVRLSGEGQVEKHFAAEAPDVESLLVAFLSELVYYQEQENLTFTDFKVQIGGSLLSVDMKGKPTRSMDKAIKAVTYHNLRIQRTARGLEAEIVLDV
jgi:SHS2 domain-containing protein